MSVARKAYEAVDWVVTNPISWVVLFIVVFISIVCGRWWAGPAVAVGIVALRELCSFVAYQWRQLGHKLGAYSD